MNRTRETHPVESALLGALLGGVALLLLLDVIAALAAAVAGGGWTWTSPSDMVGVASRLPDATGDPRQAWPTSAHSALPGAAAMYATAVGVLLALVAAVALTLRRRGRHTESKSARWASRRDLRPLHVNGSAGVRIPLGRAHGRRLAAEPRQSVLVVAPTQSGKTTALAIPAILEWNGPVVATSVKTDLVRDTIRHRAELGRTQVFDPTGSTALSETSSWTPILGCRTWQGARRTAAWLTDAASLKRGGLSDGDFWYAAAAKLLAPLLFAAATNGCTIEQVITWLDKQESGEVLAALEYAGCVEALNAMEANWSRDERQRSSIYTKIGRAHV